MAKGKKTIIKEIERLNSDIVKINGREYVIIEDTPNIDTAITMKISSHGNRILRFEDLSKKATIDVKRDINILKFTFEDEQRAKRFKTSYERSILTNQDKKEIINNAPSHIIARSIISEFTSKQSPKYDEQSGITTFYLSQEVK
ncbi:MAG: hypothetical protein U9O56_00360 [Campylobacterota bacterium]|nr:hypothetical protein [Campylobacterota bacterium]